MNSGQYPSLYTERDEDLLKAVSGVCEDYTEDEILKALGRKVLQMSHSPVYGQGTTLGDVQVLTYGHQQMAYHYQRGMCRRHAMLLAAGLVSGVVANWQESFPGLRIW